MSLSLKRQAKIRILSQCLEQILLKNKAGSNADCLPASLLHRDCEIINFSRIISYLR